MPDTVPTLTEQAATKYADYQRLMEAELTQESVLQAETLLNDIRSLKSQIEDEKAHEDRILALKSAGSDLDAWIKTPTAPAPFGTETRRDLAQFVGSKPNGSTQIEERTENGEKKWYVSEDGDNLLTDKQLQAVTQTGYKDAFRQYMRKGIMGLASPQLKVLQEGEDGEGGYLVPPDILQRLIQRAPAPTRVNGRVMTINTSRDRVTLPKVNYTSDDIYTTGIRVTATGELPASNLVHRVTDPAFGKITIPINTFMMSLPVTNDMLEDTSFPLQAWISGKFVETIDLFKDNQIVNGIGDSNFPSGILKAPGTAGQPAVVGSLDANILTSDGIVSIAFSIPEQYDENCCWVFNKSNTGKAIASMKDGEGRYIWNNGVLGTGLSNMSARAHPLQGYDVVYNAFMPNIAANAYPAILGDLTGYYAVNRVGFSIQVLRELYAETNQQLILGRLRFGGQVAEEFKIKVLKVTATP